MTWIRRELNSIGVPPLKKFGQHFLFDTKTREKLIELAELTNDDDVLEVGPGLGFLTSMLVERAGHVIAVEKDRALAAHLKSKFSTFRNLTVIQGDILDYKMPDHAKIVASPPYNISSRLLLKILSSKFKFAAMIMQEEFVTRLTAPCGSRDYGRLTVMLQFKAQAKFIQHVSKSVFYPPPRVDSALVTIAPITECLKADCKLEELVRVLFTQRRRRLHGVLMRYLRRRYPSQVDFIMQKISVPEKRVYETTPIEFAVLSEGIEQALGDLGEDS